MIYTTSRTRDNFQNSIWSSHAPPRALFTRCPRARLLPRVAGLVSPAVGVLPEFLGKFQSVITSSFLNHFRRTIYQNEGIDETNTSIPASTPNSPWIRRKTPRKLRPTLTTMIPTSKLLQRSTPRLLGTSLTHLQASKVQKLTRLIFHEQYSKSEYLESTRKRRISHLKMVWLHSYELHEFDGVLSFFDPSRFG